MNFFSSRFERSYPNIISFETPLREEQVEIVELDEMHTYIGEKNYCWIWIAVDRFGKRFFDLVCGDRSTKTDLKLWGKRTYKINTNVSYGFLKNKIITLFFSNTDVEDIVGQLKILLKSELVPMRFGRSNKRNVQKYNRRKKPKVVKNQKDTI